MGETKFSVGDIVEYQASQGWHERDSLNGAIGTVLSIKPSVEETQNCACAGCLYLRMLGMGAPIPILLLPKIFGSSKGPQRERNYDRPGI